MSDLARNLQTTIDDAFEKRADITPATKGPVREAVETALDLLDRGKARVAERGGNGAWTVNQWLKKAVLLSFRLSDNGPVAGAAGELDLVGQGADQVRGLGQQPLQGGGLPRRTGLRGAPLGLYRAERLGEVGQELPGVGIVRRVDVEHRLGVDDLPVDVRPQVRPRRPTCGSPSSARPG